MIGVTMQIWQDEDAGGSRKKTADAADLRAVDDARRGSCQSGHSLLCYEF